MTEPNEPSRPSTPTEKIASRGLESASTLESNPPKVNGQSESNDGAHQWSAEVNDSPNESDGLGSVDVEVDHPESDEKPLSSILARAKARMEFGEITGEKPSRKELANKEDKDREAVSVILSMLVVTAIVFAYGEDVKPTEDEAEGFCEPVASIIARHVPIPTGASEDVIDLIAAGGVALLWWKRVAPELKARRDSPPPSSPPPPRRPTPRDNGHKLPTTAAETFMEKSK